MQTACPTCKTERSTDSSNPCRPFCSERCRLIDLGQWLAESYTISEPLITDKVVDDYPDPVKKY